MEPAILDAKAMQAFLARLKQAQSRASPGSTSSSSPQPPMKRSPTSQAESNEVGRNRAHAMAVWESPSRFNIIS